LDPAPVGAACDVQNPCAGEAACGENGRCPLPVGTHTGTCSPITGTCTMLDGDGYCLEVNTGDNPPSWVGICIAGGSVRVGQQCTFGAERSEKSVRCGEGASCAVAIEETPSFGTCHQGCSPPDAHGTVACPEGTSCYAAGGYACLGPDEICDPAANDSCGENTKCAFFGWDSEQAFCMGYDPDRERAIIGQTCSAEGAECVEGSVCLALSNEPAPNCKELCRSDGTVGCSAGTQCRSLSSLSGGRITGPYGLCLSG
jgi:hypothetical protein